MSDPSSFVPSTCAKVHSNFTGPIRSHPLPEGTFLPGRKLMRIFALSLLAASIALTAAAQDQDQNQDHDFDRSPIQHVLLISIDGMHAVDFLNCAHGIAGVNNGDPYCPNLASLSAHGINYVAAHTSKPYDSFPGLMNIVTGATPRTMGVYYDVAYDRSLDGPKVETGNNNGPGPCTPNTTPTGFTTEYEE